MLLIVHQKYAKFLHTRIRTLRHRSSAFIELNRIKFGGKAKKSQINKMQPEQSILVWPKTNSFSWKSRIQKLLKAASSCFSNHCTVSPKGKCSLPPFGKVLENSRRPRHTLISKEKSPHVACCRKTKSRLD